MLTMFSTTSWLMTFWITNAASHTIATLEDFKQTVTTTANPYGDLGCLRNVTDKEIYKLNSSVKSLCIMNSFVSKLQEDSLSRFKSLRILALINVSLTEVLPNALSELSDLRKVDFTNNKIISLPSSTFQSNQNLEELSLSGNNISEAKELMSTLSRLKRFRRLDLGGNSIESLDMRNDEFPKLEILSLKKCQLSTFAASPFPSLKKLHLGTNQLTPETLDLSSLNGSDALKELHLGNNPSDETDTSSAVYNYFPEIGTSFLPYLPSLQLLDLQNCYISSVSSTAFDMVPQLESLILRSNNLPMIPPAVASLKNLRDLDMSYNGKKEIPFSLKRINFTVMKSLNRLDLSFTKLITLREDSFYGLSNLISLSVANTELSEIKAYAFRSLKSLQWLDLSNNHLTVIINDTFADLVSLTHLKLSSNSIKIYPINHPFLPTRSLVKLEFQHNSLCELWDYLIVQLSNLTYLDMSYNKIVEWRWDAFPSSGNLKFANFEDNEIKTMPLPMLKNLLSLEKGIFSNNPYNCTDCDIVNVQKLLKSPTYSPYKDGYLCQNKYIEGDDFVYNATIPPRCSGNSFSYVGIGVGTGFLLIFIVAFASLIYYYRWYIRYRWFVARCHLKTWHKPLQRKQSYMYDAFISYCEKDRYWIKNEFLPRLENDFNFHFCVHERDFEAGRNITDNIFEGIDKSKMFIAILTDDFLASQWCMWEMNMAISKMAIEQGYNLVIIKLHAVSRDKLPRNVEYLMKTRTYISWPVTPVGQRLFWEKMIHILQKCTLKNSNDATCTANPA